MNKLYVFTTCATLMFLTYCSPFAYAQNSGDAKPAIRRIIDPETSARELSDKMRDELKLTDKQYKKVYKLNLKEAKAMAENRKPGQAEGGKAGMHGSEMLRGDRRPDMFPGGERPEHRNKLGKDGPTMDDNLEQIKEREEKMEKNMKKILDDEQYEKWQAMMKDRKEQMKREFDLRRQRIELGLPDQ